MTKYDNVKFEPTEMSTDRTQELSGGSVPSANSDTRASVKV